MPQVDINTFIVQAFWLFFFFWILIINSLFYSFRLFASSNKKYWRLKYRKNRFQEYFYKNLDAGWGSLISTNAYSYFFITKIIKKKHEMLGFYYYYYKVNKFFDYIVTDFVFRWTTICVSDILSYDKI